MVSERLEYRSAVRSSDQNCEICQTQIASERSWTGEQYPLVATKYDHNTWTSSLQSQMLQFIFTEVRLLTRQT